LNRIACRFDIFRDSSSKILVVVPARTAFINGSKHIRSYRDCTNANYWNVINVGPILDRLNDYLDEKQQLLNLIEQGKVKEAIVGLLSLALANGWKKEAQAIFLFGIRPLVKGNRQDLLINQIYIIMVLSI